MTSRKRSSFNVSSAFIGLGLLVAASACGTNSDSIGAVGRGGNGGGPSAGGASSQGSGGSGGASGLPGSGGAPAMGGAVSTGGSLGTGGMLSSGGARADSGVGGAAGQSGDAGNDALVSIDGSALARLCLTTGGQISSGLCCASVTEFPSSCSDGACGCASTNSHTIPTCTCPGASCFSQTAGCTYSGKPGTGGSGGTLDGGPADAPGTGGSDGGKSDLATSSDGLSQAELCVATGGQVTSGPCCGSAGDFPNSCLTGACGCALANSHTVATCTCPSGGCFVPSVGCTRYSEEADAASAQMDGNGCTAWPEGDATRCGGTKPPHFYTCVMTMLTDPCAIVSIGDMTNTFCCP
jgi:hypothetical protein